MYINNFFEPRAEEQTHILHGVPKVLNTEHALQLYSGETLLHSFVCSPCQLGELCAGWLLTEGYGGNAVTVSPEGNRARVEGAASFPATLKAQSPTICHTSPEEMLALFNSAADKHARTHGIHECVIKGTDWQVICTDIGRHNAIDKAVGAAHLAGYDLTGAVLFTSGRINVQTVKKAARCGFGCLMSKAVITHEAWMLSQELGLNVLFSVK